MTTFSRSMAAKPNNTPCLLTWTSWRCKQLTSRDLLAFVTMFLGGCLCMVRILPLACCMGPHAHHPDNQQQQQQQEQCARPFLPVGSGPGHGWPMSGSVGCPTPTSQGTGCRSWPLRWRLVCGCWTGLPAWPMQDSQDTPGTPTTHAVQAAQRRLMIVSAAVVQVSLANMVAGWCIGCLAISWHPWTALLGMVLTAMSLPGWQRPASPQGSLAGPAPTAPTSTTAPAASWRRWQLLWRPPGWLWQRPGVRTAALLVVRLVSSCIPWLCQGPLRPPEPYLALLPNTHLSHHVQFAWVGWMAYTLPVFGSQQVVAGLLSWLPMAYAACRAEPAAGSLLPYIRLWATSFLLIVVLPYFGTVHLERSLKQQYAQHVCRVGASRAQGAQGKAGEEQPIEACQAPHDTEVDASWKKACSGSSIASSSRGSSLRRSISSSSKGSSQSGAAAAARVAVKRLADSSDPVAVLRTAAAPRVAGMAAALGSTPQASLAMGSRSISGSTVSTACDVQLTMPSEGQPFGTDAAAMPLPAAARPAPGALGRQPLVASV